MPHRPAPQRPPADSPATVGGEVFRRRYADSLRERGYARGLVARTAAAFGICLLIGAGLSQLPEAVRTAVIEEGGPVESASGVLYLLLAAGLAATALRRGLDGEPSRSPGVVDPLLAGGCAAVLAARESDWHNGWTTMGVLKTRFYVSPEVSAVEKAAAAAVLAAVGVLLAATAWRCGRPLADRLRASEPAAWLTAVGIWLLPLSKAMDSLPGILKKSVGELPAAAAATFRATEEVAELAAPAMLAAALAASVAGASRRKDVREPASAAKTRPVRRAA